MFSIEKILMLVDWLSETGGKKSTDSIVFYINETLMPVMSDSGGDMNCIEGVSSDVFHFEGGIHLVMTQSYDSFGSSVHRDADLSIGHIADEKTLEIWSMEYVNVNGDGESEYHVASVEDVAAVIQFIKKNSEDWDVSDHKRLLLNYLQSHSTTGVTAYALLDENDPLKSDTDILAGLADKVYAESAAQYSDIVSYDAISPYGGEDITYYPSSVAQCFFDHFYPSMESIGATAFFPKRELIEAAYSCLYRQGERKAIVQLINEYDSDAKTLATQDDVFNQFQLVKQKRNLCKKAKLLRGRIMQANTLLSFLECSKSEVESKEYQWWLKLFFRPEYRRNLRADRRELSSLKKRMVACERVLKELNPEESNLYGRIEQLDAQMNRTIVQRFHSQNYFRKWLRKAKARQVTDKIPYEYCKGLLAEQLERSA